MTSNLFGKLSAGVAGVAGATLVAIGVGSTPVQAATIKIEFHDRSVYFGRQPFSGYPGFDGSFLWNSDLTGTQSISNWKLDILPQYRSTSGMTNTVTDSSYSGNSLTVNVRILSQQVAQSLFPGIANTSNQLSFMFDDISQDGRWLSGPLASIPVADTMRRGSSEVLQADGGKSKWDDVRYTAVPEPSTYVGTILAFGALGAVKVLKRKQKNKETFTP